MPPAGLCAQLACIGLVGVVRFSLNEAPSCPVRPPAPQRTRGSYQSTILALRIHLGPTQCLRGSPSEFVVSLHAHSGDCMSAVCLASLFRRTRVVIWRRSYRRPCNMAGGGRTWGGCCSLLAHPDCSGRPFRSRPPPGAPRRPQFSKSLLHFPAVTWGFAEGPPPVATSLQVCRPLS